MRSILGPDDMKNLYWTRQSFETRSKESKTLAPDFYQRSLTPNNLKLK